MMQQIGEKQGGRTTLQLVSGDAVALPFRDKSFGGALIIHVLHSVPRWERVVQEAVRVTREGGKVVLDPGNGPVPLRDSIEARFIKEIGQQPGRSEWTVEMTDVEFARLGCVIRALPDVEVRFMQAPSEYISRLELGQASWQWELDASAFGPAAERVRTWATKEFGSLDEPRELTGHVSMLTERCRFLSEAAAVSGPKGRTRFPARH
jgi:SAM-dependent methyltransferase